MPRAASHPVSSSSTAGGWRPSPSLLCLLALLLLAGPPAGGGGQEPELYRNGRDNHHRHLAEVWSSISFSSHPTPPPEAPAVPNWNSIAPEPPEQCPGCVDRRAVVETGARETELMSLRIEFIKQQILKKLRLKEPPTGIAAKSVLPKPLSSGALLHKSTPYRGSDDFYGKTEQVILFPESVNMNCPQTRQVPSACFTFRFPAELNAEDVTSAQLWIYKERDKLDGQNQTFVVSEVDRWEVSVQRPNQLALQVTSVMEGWVRINLLWAVKHWLEYSELPHAIKVACETCGMDSSKSPISLLPENKPFLVINTNSNSVVQRPKRNLNCVPGLSECCRESLYVSFADIGWDDWILQPPGYHAYFCRGSCSNAASLTQSGSYYTTVMQRLLHQQGKNKKPELVPCCTATHLSPIQLIYMDNTQTITQKILPNMAVDACGCM